MGDLNYKSKSVPLTEYFIEYGESEYAGRRTGPGALRETRSHRGRRTTSAVGGWTYPTGRSESECRVGGRDGGPDVRAALGHVRATPDGVSCS